MSATKNSGTIKNTGLSLAVLAAVAFAPAGMAWAQNKANEYLVAPESLPVDLKANLQLEQVTEKDMEDLQRDLQGTVPSTGTTRQPAAGSSSASAPAPSGGGASPPRGQQIIRPASSASASAPTSSGGAMSPGAGSVSMATGGLTSFSNNIPDVPPSPYLTGEVGAATAYGSVYVEPDPAQRTRMAPFEDPLLQPKDPPPQMTIRQGRARAGSLRGVDAKDLNLRHRSRPVAAGLNCSPPNLRLEEINDPRRPNTFRLTGFIETPNRGYGYEVHPTAERSSFIRPTGGPSLMSMTISMKAPPPGDYEPDDQVKIDELVTVAPGTLRLDVVVNNIIFRRNQMYYCRIPGRLDGVERVDLR